MWFNRSRKGQNKAKHSAVRPPATRWAFHPVLEGLENRWLPSTLTVTNLSDHDPGSLRDAITQAAPGDTINFAGGLQGTITLTTGELALHQNVDIEGPGASQITVSGNHASRVFDISRGANVTIANLTVANGQVLLYFNNVNAYADAGGIYNAGNLVLVGDTVTGCVVDSEVTNSSGHLLFSSSYGGGLFNNGTAYVADCSFTQDAAYAGFSSSNFDSVCVPSGHGGAIANLGVLTLADSTLDGNQTAAAGEGGALYNSGQAAVSGSTFSNNEGFGGASGNTLLVQNVFGGAIANDQGSLALTNCTVVNNQATNTINGPGQVTSQGGGVYSVGALSMLNCTVTGNSASATAQGGATALVQGGGVYVDPGSPQPAQAGNTIIAGNSATTHGPDAFGAFASQGHNLIGQTDGSSGWVASDLTGTTANPLNARLGSLGNYGGPSNTIPLLAGSPGLDAGDPALAPATDQRYVPRGATPNIGAYEATAVSLNVTGPVNVTAGQAFNVTVTAVDPYGQTAVGYTGTVSLSSSDPQDPVLGQYTFTLADGGQYTFTGVVLNTSGLQTVSASDNGGLTGSYQLLVQGGGQVSSGGAHAAPEAPAHAATPDPARFVPTGDVPSPSHLAGAADPVRTCTTQGPVADLADLSNVLSC
jgi:hypothetical protein